MVTFVRITFDVLFMAPFANNVDAVTEVMIFSSIQVPLEPFENYMNADYAVRCHDPFTAWGASAALATTMLFTIGLGIPVYLLFRLRAYDIFVRHQADAKGIKTIQRQPFFR